jgi:recombination protein U
MGYQHTRGLRGSVLEELINMTNEVYKQRHVAIIQKIPTPITPIELDREQGNISRAFFNQASTVDYIGAVQGIPICFDAKETAETRLPLQNVHQHQIEFMDEFELNKGVAFLIVNFKKTDEYFILPYSVLKDYWNKAKNGGRKSIPYSAFDKDLLIHSQNGYVLNYLDTLNTLLTKEG